MRSKQSRKHERLAVSALCCAGDSSDQDASTRRLSAAFTADCRSCGFSGRMKGSALPRSCAREMLILHANKLILDTVGTANQFVLNEGSKVQGNIVIGKNSSISRDSFITGPAIIGDHCTIGPAARIGPYVSVGNNSVLKKCDVENSIIMDGCKINSKIHISDSIVAHVGRFGTAVR